MADDAVSAPFGIGEVTIARWLGRFADLVDRDRDRLTELDAAIGDADHGLNMARGMAAVRALVANRAASEATPGAICRDAAMTLISTVGGASGPLYGTFLLRLGSALGDAASVDGDGLVAGLRAGVEGVRARGRAEAGDKTMLDAMLPAVEALEAGDGSATARRAAVGPEAFRRAAVAAAAGSDATVPLIARKGRASYLGERSAGHRDPGAASTALLFEALAEAIADGHDTPVAPSDGPTMAGDR